MKVIIAGAGIAGSYLGRMLESQPTLYDNNPKPGCGCGWGTARSQVKRLLGEVGLNLDDFILCKVEGYIDNKVFIPLRNCITINKPQLVYDMRKGLNIKKKRYSFTGDRENLVVNATGIPSDEAVFRIQTFQERAVVKGAMEKVMYSYVNPRYAGYAWLFPLDEEGQLFHCGAGCFEAPPERIIKEMLIYYGLEKKDVKCSCGVNLYLADPRAVDLVRENLVAVGGAAGCVNPITGEGILPAMETASLLAKTLKNGSALEEYAASVRKMLEKYDKPYTFFYRMLTSPAWGWLSGLRYNTTKTIENFEPAPRFGTSTKLLLTSGAIYLKPPRAIKQSSALFGKSF